MEQMLARSLETLKNGCRELPIRLSQMRITGAVARVLPKTSRRLGHSELSSLQGLAVTGLLLLRSLSVKFGCGSKLYFDIVTFLYFFLRCQMVTLPRRRSQLRLRRGAGCALARENTNTATATDTRDLSIYNGPVRWAIRGQASYPLPFL